MAECAMEIANQSINNVHMLSFEKTFSSLIALGLKNNNE
jgi:hypothetical protein